MNTIKFRQAIFSQGKFSSFHYWGFLSDGVFVGPETNASTISEAKRNSKMYTSLHDKNGKEIYEGDIVQYTSAKMLPTGRISLTEFETKKRVVEFMNSSVIQGYNVYQAMNPEVVGNLYESPELLGDDIGYGI